MDELEIMCTSHIQRVTLADGDVWIRHKDGGYCDSEQFAIETLTRTQVMALLLVACGERLMGRTQPQLPARLR